VRQAAITLPSILTILIVPNILKRYSDRGSWIIIPQVGVPSLLTIHIIHTRIADKVVSYRQSNTNQ
jgi:hypothetical protein